MRENGRVSLHKGADRLLSAIDAAGLERWRLSLQGGGSRCREPPAL